MEETDAKADTRVRVMLEHLSGQLTATQAAVELGVSRKTFYEWLDRAKEAMRLALTDRLGGRPPKPVDPEKDRLHEQVDTLEKERLVLESRLRIQKAFQETLDSLTDERSPKKRVRGPPG